MPPKSSGCSKRRIAAQRRLQAAVLSCKLAGKEDRLQEPLSEALARMGAPTVLLEAMTAIYNDIADGGQGVNGSCARLLEKAARFWRREWPSE